MFIIVFLFWCCMFSIIFIFIEQLMGLRHPRAGVLVVSAGETTMEYMEYIYSEACGHDTVNVAANQLDQAENRAISQQRLDQMVMVPPSANTCHQPTTDRPSGHDSVISQQHSYYMSSTNNISTLRLVAVSTIFSGLTPSQAKWP